jgi:hypothetical protein
LAVHFLDDRMAVRTGEALALVGEPESVTQGLLDKGL